MHNSRSQNGKIKVRQISKMAKSLYKGLKNHYIRIELRRRKTLQTNSTNSKGERFFHLLVLQLLEL